MSEREKGKHERSDNALKVLKSMTALPGVDESTIGEVRGTIKFTAEEESTSLKKAVEDGDLDFDLGHSRQEIQDTRAELVRNINNNRISEEVGRQILARLERQEQLVLLRPPTFNDRLVALRGHLITLPVKTFEGMFNLKRATDSYLAGFANGRSRYFLLAALFSGTVTDFLLYQGDQSILLYMNGGLGVLNLLTAHLTRKKVDQNFTDTL